MKQQISKYKISKILLATLLSLTLNNVYAADMNAIQNLQQTGKAFAAIAKSVSPAVVNVQSDMSAGGADGADPNEEDLPDDIPAPYLDLFRNIDPRMQPFRKHPVLRQGSGFIISPDGYIVTNNHLVEKANKITVKLQNKTEYTAKIIGTDPQSDIALIKIDATNLPTVSLGNSDQAEIGEWVVALGNPFGLSHSLSAGILSATGRSQIGIADYENFLQTDAAINPGNSGGPLLDLDGKVIGINTAIFSRSGGYMGIGFAIPINMAKPIIEQLRSKGSVVRGYMGVRIQELTQDLAQSFSSPAREGILVAEVEKGSPADKAGIKQGDIIIKLDGVVVDNTGDFRNNIAATKPGVARKLSVVRNQKPVELQVAVGDLSVEQASKEGKTDETLSNLALGVSVQNVTADIAAKLGYKANTGVIISKVKPGSIAELAGLMRGAVILEVNRQGVNSVKDFTAAMTSAAKSKAILFLLQDQYGSRYVVINLG
jgi:serine protease Do